MLVRTLTTTRVLFCGYLRISTVLLQILSNQGRPNWASSYAVSIARSQKLGKVVCSAYCANKKLLIPKKILRYKTLFGKDLVLG